MTSSATADFNFDTSALSTIKSVPDIGALPGLCAAGDTLYLDLDETIISAEPDAAEPAAKALATALHQHGADLTASWEAACFVWEAFQGPCAVRPTDGAATLAALTELQQRGLHIVGLTARAPSVSRETELQLERCGMLRVFSPLTLGHISEAEGPTLPPLTHRHGIIYCTGSRKVAVDDKLQNLEHIQELLQPSGRSYLGIHYTAPDAAARAAYQPPRPILLLAAALSNPRGRSRLEAALKTMRAAPRASGGLGVLAVAQPDYAAAAARAALKWFAAAKVHLSRHGAQAVDAVDRIPAPEPLRLPIATAGSLLAVAAVVRMLVWARRQ